MSIHKRPDAGISRRAFASTALASVGMLCAPSLIGRARAGGAAIKLGAILDLSGGLDIYGKPMLMAMELAVQEINASGGIGGRNVEIVTYDTQSNMQLYAQYAQQAALQDRVDVVHGGITSASREVMRPILRRHNTLYIYSTLYEGGVCDRNTFCTGSTPAMAQQKPMQWAVNKWGNSFYSVGADYNAPRVMSDWNRRFGAEVGATQIANEFFPLAVTEFGSLITKIQAAKPAFVASCLVGAAHLGFYRQWAAAGMVGKIPILSFTFGAGNEHVMLPPEASEGIVGAYTYFQELDNPLNKAFVNAYRAKFGADAPYQNAISFGGYEGTWLWAQAARDAKSAERQAVIAAFEKGATWNGPGGKMVMNGPTHQAIRDIAMGRCAGGKWEIFATFPQQSPLDVVGKCDLIANPSLNVQFGAE